MAQTQTQTQTQTQIKTQPQPRIQPGAPRRTTVDEKELARIVAGKYGHLAADEIVMLLCRIGVVDHVKCRVLVIRRWVEARVKEGLGKVEAMWLASEKFCCTYEYVRKCLYYYKDVNF